MNITITRLIAIGYTSEKAEKLHKMYDCQNRLKELEDYIELKESTAHRAPEFGKDCLSY